jgi:4-carboxymuconolactone decarboxylase
MSSDRYLRGRARQAEIGSDRTGTYDALAELAPDLPRFAVEFAYGDIHARPGLDAIVREIVVVAVLVAQGGVDASLRAHLATALTVGASPAQLVEVILQTLPYVGFPRVFAAMGLLREVIADGRD